MHMMRAEYVIAARAPIPCTLPLSLAGSAARRTALAGEAPREKLGLDRAGSMHTMRHAQDAASRAAAALAAMNCIGVHVTLTGTVPRNSGVSGACEASPPAVRCR